ncbi:hypothetical protein [Fodinicola feengrottensis]|uniref:Uncharacterized protein n=1 Tax=Fodinicola feengrottensis TaxID=435914 RepID=A0ABN2FV32_9ACTN|nr:hypothetical protein [Fodinicola feengrottensis]
MDLLVALVVVAVLALILRWAYGSPRPKDAELAEFMEQQRSQDPTSHPLSGDPEPHEAAVPDGPPAGRYGLLVAVARVATEADGLALKAVLAEAKIRATTSQEDDSTVVLVFPVDAPRARRLVSQR